MKKYEIIRETQEFEIYEVNRIEGICAILSEEPETVEVFDTVEDTLEALKDYKSCIYDVGNAIPRYCVEQYHIEENEYDEDGECVDGGDIIDYTPLEIVLEVDDEEVGRFDNYMEAQKAFDEIEDDPDYEDSENNDGFKYVKVHLRPFYDNEVWIKR